MYRQRVSFCNRKSPGDVEDQKKLSEALKVNKLCNNELRVYFPGIKASRQEYLRQTQHYEGFKKALNSKKVDVDNEGETAGEFITAYNMKEFLKRYGLRKKKDVEKPAMRRTPLRSLKTVKIELPGPYATEAIISAPRKNKPINKSQDKFASKGKEGKEQEEEVDPQVMIEKQLEQTKNEISLASTQLEQIKELLKQRKLTLTPVLEEAEEVQRVVQTVDRKCSAMQPQTQWMAKSVNTDNPPSKNKNRLMLTLNNLNQRLQKIQEKYFNAPRIRYKSIRDFPSEDTYVKDVSLQTIYRNSQYETGRQEKTTEIDLFIPPNQHGVDRSSPSIQVLFSPHRKIIDSSDEIVCPKSSKSILKKESKFDEYVIEAPSLQESICKSSYLMKEFNVPSKDFNIELGRLLDKNTNKKNVRFNHANLYRSQEDHPKTQNLISTLDFAMRNSLFYPEN